jgi:hypothetical protein
MYIKIRFSTQDFGLRIVSIRVTRQSQSAAQAQWVVQLSPEIAHDADKLT